MGAYFVTGSGTDVGKTYVAAALIRRLRAEGRTVAALKPLVSGHDPDNPSSSDPAVLLEALAQEPDENNIARIAPWRFRAPLSPDMAAAAEGRAIDIEALEAFCRAAIAEAQETLLIEGVGGVMVPLTPRATQLDLMRALKIPLIFVAGSYLGALSHALTGLEVLRRSRLDVRAVVVNETPDSPVDLDATCASLANFTEAPLLALRRGGAANDAMFARLAAML